MQHYEKITVLNPLESLPKKVSGYYSNGLCFNDIYRATLHAMISRGYYKDPTDPIDHAYIIL